MSQRLWLHWAVVAGRSHLFGGGGQARLHQSAEASMGHMCGALAELHGEEYGVPWTREYLFYE